MEGLKEMLWLAAAGVSGAIIGLSMHPAKRSVLQRFVFVLSGLLVAFWLTPIICRYFGLAAAEEISAVAFAAGAFWSSIVDKAGKILETVLTALVKGASKHD